MFQVMLIPPLTTRTTECGFYKHAGKDEAAPKIHQTKCFTASSKKEKEVER